MSSSSIDIATRVDKSGWSASLYNKTAPFNYSAAFTAPILELLAAQPGERIIDFGCGSGEITLELQKHVAGAPGAVVVGIDLSESMLARAKENGVEHAFVGDLEALELPDNIPGTAQHKFDAVFSNATLHWCKRHPAGVLESAKRVLKPGGRIAAEMGGFLNCVGVRSVIHHVLRKRGYDPMPRDPWFFPSVEDYEKLLTDAGFKINHISLNPRLTPLAGGVSQWLQMFARHSFLSDLSDEEAKEIMDEVEDICRVDCRDESGKWFMMFMRLRFQAVLE
ncbi:hypothetical protein H0H87_004609 [Tephrocybe sp. NHM501043]|nr:hypothetical protein H0H87_004609 [Tephrocybe sp. NHM501043]